MAWDPRGDKPLESAPDLIAGFCRFSYLGRGDWSALRNRDMAEIDWDARARLLYDPARLEARFTAFEQVCLPSILAQDDPRFVFVVATSPDLPEPWMGRLESLCAQSPKLHLEVIADRDLGHGLAPLLGEMTERAGRNLVQFRLDDDDALASDTVARLRRLSDRMADLPEFGVSIARGLSVALYPGHPVTPMLHDQPFLGAALAVRFAQPQRTIFSVGHFGVARRMTHIVDRGPPGSLVLKWPSDSRPVDLDHLPAFLTRLDERSFQAELRKGFPWLLEADFDRLRQTAAEALPALVATSAHNAIMAED